MDPVTIGLLLAGTAANVGASIFGAEKQTEAAKAATQAQMDMFNRIQGMMQPYVNFGANWGIPGYQEATGRFEGAIPGLTAPMTAADVQGTPGFQFMLDQGLKATQAGYASQGLGSSGAAIKGAGQYETGLASTTIPQWLNLLLGQRQQIYSQLKGAIDPYGGAIRAGTEAGQAIGQFGTTAATNVGQNIMGAANAQAAAAMGAAGTIGNLPGQYMQYSLYNKLMGQGASTPQTSTAMGAPTGMPAGPWSTPTAGNFSVAVNPLAGFTGAPQ
jgi:hypothetical protein